jgi:glycine betaine catabolism A
VHVNHPAHIELAQRLIALNEGGAPTGARVGEVLASEYLSPERFAHEQAAVFARVPQIVAHESELAEPGACLTVDVAGVPLLLTRDKDGALHAFKNACRHRGTRLVSEDAPCRRKALVCPYHGWTYDLRGKLTHVPHESSFAGAQAGRAELAPAYAASRSGLVFAGLAPFDLDAHFGPIAGELASLAEPPHVVYKRTVREVRGNWKLIVDAFLEGYHVRHLHRGSVGRFFLDARSETMPVFEHIRAATARRTFVEADPANLANLDLRALMTPSYFVFPATILIMHPDYFSVMMISPLSPDRTRFTHAMLIPAAARTPDREEHWAKSFALIDEGVFFTEDLATVESMQRGLESGANETLLFGALEHAALWFHESLARRIAAG